jgi:hypothetical protein
VLNQAEEDDKNQDRATARKDQAVKISDRVGDEAREE